MKVKIHLYQPSTPPLSTTQSSPRITIVFSLVFRLLEISMLPICITYMFLSCKYIIFGRIKPVHIIPKLTFFHCTAYLLFIYRDLACFLSCLVWLYHIRFVTPQVTFKLSLICDHCKQCWTAHPYPHMQIFFWDRYQAVEMLGMLCTFWILINITKLFPLSIFLYLFIA